MVAFHMAPTWDLACNPGMRPDWESNQRPFGSQHILNPLSYTSQDLFMFFKYFIHLFLGRGERREKEKERNIDVREKHQSVASTG